MKEFNDPRVRLTTTVSAHALAGVAPSATSERREYPGRADLPQPFAEPITVTIPMAINYSGLGRTKLYEMIARKEIESVRVGARRLIVFASLKARLTDDAAKGEAAND